MSWLPGWGHRMPITIDHTKIDSDLTHFPVPIVLTGTDAEAVITEVGNAVSAKSVVFDIADNWGTTFLGIRQIDFWSSGSKITMTTNYTAYVTSHYNADFRDVFDTSLGKTGGWDLGGGSWLSPNGNNTNQRLIIVFDTVQTFDQIRVNNFHDSGGATGHGAQNVKIHISTDTITSTTYNAVIANSELIFDGQFDEHVASDVEDEQTLELPIGSNKIAVGLPDKSQLYCEIEQWDAVNNKITLWVSRSDWIISSTEDTTLYLYYDGTQDDNTDYVGDISKSDIIFGPITDDSNVGSSTRTWKVILNSSTLTASSTNIHKLVFMDGSSYTLDAVYIGYQAASGDSYDVEPGSLVQVTKDGSTLISVSSGSNVSDSFELEIDGTKTLIVSFSYISEAPRRLLAGPVGTAAYYKDSVSEAGTENVSGYTSHTIFPIVEQIFNVLPSQNVWNSDFVARYGMAQDPSGGADCIIDSTVNANHGTPNGSMTSADLVDGPVGKAIEFDGSDDYVSLPIIGLDTESVTFSCWMNSSVSDQPEDWAALICAEMNNGEYVWTLRHYSNEETIQTSVWTTDGYQMATSPEAYSVDADEFYTGVWDFENSQALLYKNDTLIATESITGTVNTHDKEVRIASSRAGRFFKAVIDEVRISSGVKSIDWIKADYHAQNNTLLSFGDEELPLVFFCEGAVLDAYTPMSGASVNLYLRSTGELVDSTITTSSGTFSMSSQYNDYHFAVAFYNNDTRNALIYDYLSPTVSGGS